MRQAELIELLGERLKSLPAVAGALLGGSFGRGDADDYSDVEIGQGGLIPIRCES
ncbi:MAG: hypothetical protein OXH09_04455 [Gammaproteobacteria bacterium]|nr:hypothetical protein [Gammaproteobacteria bacterium]